MADTDFELSDLELAAWRGFLRAHATVTRELDAELEAAVGMPVQQYEVLMLLREAGGRLRMAELADRALLSRSGMTRLVDRAVKGGLVTREKCADDARGTLAVLTEEGRVVLGRARPVHLEGVRRRYVARLSRGQLEALAGAWQDLMRRD